MQDFLNKHKWILITWNIISVIAVIFSFYAYYCPFNQNPNVKIYEKNITNVFELKEENKDLKVFFKEKDILKEKLNLKVFTLKIINDGRSDIIPNNFDTINEPFGLKVINGTIINAEIYNPSIKSLLKVQNKSKSDSSHFIFKSFIFPSQQYFFVRMTILHTSQNEPLIQKTGRIGNVGLYYTNEEEEGTNWIGLLFFAIGLAGFLGALYLFGLLYDKIIEKIIKRRKHIILEAYNISFNGQPKYKDAIKEMYGQLGKTLFRKIKESIPDRGESLIRKALEEAGNQSVYLKAKSLSEKTKKFKVTETSSELTYPVIGENLKKYDCYNDNGGRLTLKDDFIEEINQIMNFLD